ncbi:MAG: hypothetical protein VX669_07360, partial [Planctomycetota bacterium]|nr:hypothetical protein [Planctomycetota bacterium]
MRSLIAFLTLTLLVGGPLGAMAQEDKKADKKADKKVEKKTEKKKEAPPKVVLTAAEKAAVAAIKKFGGSVLEVAQNDGRLDVAYHLADGKIGDKQLAPLKAIKHIHSLNLRGTEVTDAGLASIAGVGGLQRLHLEKTKVTDAGLAHLKGLSNLQYLNVYGTAVTDGGLKHLSGLKKLKKLYIWDTKISEGGIKSIKTAVAGLRVIPDPEIEKRRAAIDAKR